jgi:3-phenylpropionate/trans-cinnamate dioxygenase ferredoxin component
MPREVVSAEREVHLGAAPEEGGHRGYRHGDRYVLVARLGGVLHAIDDWCNHAGCLLSEGPLRGGVIVCPCHGAEFRLTDGTCVSAVRISEDQAALEVVERDGEVYLLDPATCQETP